jgi:hypothetical protein
MLKNLVIAIFQLNGFQFAFYNLESLRTASFQGLIIESNMNGRTNLIREVVDFGVILSLISFVKTNL